MAVTESALALPEATVRVQDSVNFDGSGELSFPAPNAQLVDLAVGWEPEPAP